MQTFRPSNYHCSSSTVSQRWHQADRIHVKKVDDKFNFILKGKMDKALPIRRIAVSTVFVVVTAVVFFQVDKAQPTPYMDEIFHVPQAQKYCAGNFTEWDPMITTPPGLYLVSVALIQPVSQLLQVERDDICTTQILRMTNVFFAIVNLIILDALYRKIHEENSDGVISSVVAVNISILPTLYFFTNLYYTDLGSTCFVLLAYLAYQHKNNFLAAVFGALSLFFRQTNVVWVVFLAGITFTRLLEKDTNHSKLMNKSCSSAVQLATNYALSPKNWPRLLWSLWLYGVVVVGFLVFVVINKGVVLGDKEHHEAVFHVPQLFYFSAHTLGFMAPILVSPSKVAKFLKTLRNNLWMLLPIMVCMAAVIYQFSYVHKYLLADNRHIPFYVWGKVYQRHSLVRYILIPGYLYAGWSISDSLSGKSILWRLTFLVCLAVACIPQKLLEFRYFILPFIILRLNIAPLPKQKLLAEFLLLSAINVMMMYLFLAKPFTWEDSPDTQRFMW